MMQRIFDRYSHSPIFWAFIVLLLIVSAGMAGTMDRQNAEARGETEVTR
jgi:uncharacterized membrane protein